MVENKMIVRQLGMTPYMDTYKAMHDFTAQRTEQTIDEIWLTEHPPVFTQGKVGKAQHLLSNTETIPVIQTDRGGQITYHGPGQQIMYVLIDLKRRKIGIREIVTMLENCVIETLAKHGIDAKAKADAPGVYVNNEKICSLGLHIKHGCTLHGLALNVDMDLSPFKQINPCGYSGLVMTQMSQHTSLVDRPAICHDLISAFAKPLNCELVYDPSLKQE